MAFFATHGSTSLGSHSDVETTRHEGFRLNRTRIWHEQDFPHGPVKILVRDGQRLQPPEIVPVRLRFDIDF